MGCPPRRAARSHRPHLEKLPELKRKVFLLRHREQLEYAQIAQRLRISERRVESILVEALGGPAGGLSDWGGRVVRGKYRVHEHATKWYYRLQTPISLEECRDLAKWLARDPRHGPALTEIEGVVRARSRDSRRQGPAQ